MTGELSQRRGLEARSLTLRYGRLEAVRAVNQSLRPGQVTAIVGPNGCGKSTLLAGLARLHRAAGGAVLLDGADIASLSTRDVARHIGILAQHPTAPDGMTVRDLVCFGRHPHQGLLRQWGPADEQAVERALRTAGLIALRDRRLDTLSGGQRQRAWLAMVIAQETPVVLLDEPTAALDLGHQLEVYDLIRSLASDGRTVVIVLHDLHHAARFADHLVAMRDGEIVSAGPPRSVITPEIVATLYNVECSIAPDPVTGSLTVVPIRSLRKEPRDAP
jgi:iron complex transport system ATP-binding protein